MPKNTAQRAIDISRGVAGGGGAVLYTPGGGGSSGGGGTAVTDHGGLTGLPDDDHPQYYNQTRGDARYVQLARQIATAAPLAGGGDLSADRSLSLTLGDGVETAANALRVKRHTDSGLAFGLSGGLTLGTPMTVGVSTVNAVSGVQHVHTVDWSDNPGQASKLLGTNSNGALTLRNLFAGQGVQSSAVFASGFAGSGWRADYGITTENRASIETDDLTVRGRMRIYELLIQQIRATNGSLWVSSSSKVVSVTTATNPAWTVNGAALTFNGQPATVGGTYYTVTTAAPGDTSRELYHGFLYGDLIRAQQTRWNGSTFAGVMSSKLEVVGVADLTTYTAALVEGDAAAAGLDYVRVGSTADSSRRGAVYITSDDSAAPYIDIIDGIQYHSQFNTPGTIKARLGKLTGISDQAFGGPLVGYGLYSSNVYLKGQIVVTGGSLGGLAAADVNTNTTTIDGGKITANSVTADKINVNTLAAIKADLGAVTAGQIVVGSTNKLWLNDSADGTLRIGGSVKASAPFQVSAAGHLDAIDATFGSLNIDSSGAYVVAGAAWNIGNGYRFRGGGADIGGLTLKYSATAADLALLNNITAENGNPVNTGANANTYIQNNVASGYTSVISLLARRGTVNAGMVATNATAGVGVVVHGDTLTLTRTSGTNYKVWHEYNDGAGSGLDADLLDSYHASSFALKSGAAFTGAVSFAAQTQFTAQAVFDGVSLRFTNALDTDPLYNTLNTGEAIIYLLDGPNGTIQLKVRGKHTTGATFENRLDI
jgi:hypothetical protein